MTTETKHSSVRAFNTRVLLRVTKTRWTAFLIPALFALLAAAFEGASLGLLVPTARGIMDANFKFALNFPPMESLVGLVATKEFGRNSVIFVFLIGAIVITTVLKNVFQYVSRVQIARAVNGFIHRLRVVIFTRYMSFGKLYFDSVSSGMLYDKLMGFTARLGHEMIQLENIPIFGTLLIAYLVFMAFVSPGLTLLVLLLLPIYFIFQRAVVAKIHATSKREAETSLRLSKRISDILSCIPLVKAYHRHREEEQNFSVVSNHLAQIQVSQAKKRFFIPVATECFSLFVSLVLVCGMAYMVIKEKAGNVPGFLVFFLALRRASLCFRQLSENLASAAALRGTVRTLADIFDDKGKVFVHDGTKEFPGLHSEIRFQDLHFSYPERPDVLKNISFELKKGRTTALVGPTGSGKTTLASLVIRFYDVPPGSILIDGTDIREYTMRSFRKKIAFVTQETYLFNASFRANLLYGIDPEPGIETMMEALKKARLYDFLMRLPAGLETEIGDRGVQLSGGEKQRLSIARAMLKGAETFLLDEATSSLDSQTERLIQEAIAELIRGKTTLVIAHRLSTIKKADHIVVFSAGTIAEQGTWEDLVSRRGIFYSYLEEQKFF
ncbi:MAG: ABC transporter ATP-binding protein [Candidatus Omnitrophota bacterium]